MHGNDRIYSSMSEKVLDMYSQASNYKASNLKYSENTNETVHKTTSNIRKPKKQGSSSIMTIDNWDEPLQNRFEELGDHVNTFTDEYQTFHNTHIAPIENAESSYYDSVSSTLKSYFGTSDTYSIQFAASEQENGATREPAPEKT